MSFNRLHISNKKGSITKSDEEMNEEIDDDCVYEVDPIMRTIKKMEKTDEVVFNCSQLKCYSIDNVESLVVYYQTPDCVDQNSVNFIVNAAEWYLFFPDIWTDASYRITKVKFSGKCYIAGSMWTYSSLTDSNIKELQSTSLKKRMFEKWISWDVHDPDNYVLQK